MSDAWMVFGAIMCIAIIGSVVAACITKDASCLWLLIVVLVFYLLCDGPQRVEPAAQHPTTAGAPCVDKHDTASVP